MKQTIYKVNIGYGPKRPLDTIRTIVVHTTGGRKGSLFEQEKNFLLYSRRVSAHFLVGKQGQIAEILPVEYTAWHAGSTIDDRTYGNSVSIGIECHLTYGEKWTEEMKTALTDLCRNLVVKYPSIEYIVTHRFIAPKRKVDPIYWDDEDFNNWSKGVLDVIRDVPIIGETKNKIERNVELVKERNKVLDETTLREIVYHYYAGGNVTFVDANLAIAQSIHETDWWQSFWCVNHHNMAGIGVTGETSVNEPNNLSVWAFNGKTWLRGNKYTDWQDGITSHIGRLIAYSLKEEEMTTAQKLYSAKALKDRPLPDKFKGSVKFISQLSGKWAPSPTYHDKIVKFYRLITQ